MVIGPFFVVPVGVWSALHLLTIAATVALSTTADLVDGRPCGNGTCRETSFPVWDDDERPTSGQLFASGAAEIDGLVSSLFTSGSDPEGNDVVDRRIFGKLDADYHPASGVRGSRLVWGGKRYGRRTEERKETDGSRTGGRGKESGEEKAAMLEDFPDWQDMLRGAHLGAPQSRLPQAIIIGVKKGGTRALLEFLKAHPDIKAPGPEIHFFDRHYSKGLDWYRCLMPETYDNQVTIEKTPSYFVTSSVPSRVYNMSRSVKLILVVRDPVTRAISDYTQAATKRREKRTFEQMAFLDNTTGPVATSWGAIRIGLYAKHLERWLQYFPISQFHFVHGERLIDDPASEMALMEQFLGVRRVVNEKYFYFNATKGFPCLRKPDGTGSPHCLGKTKGRVHPVVDQKVLQRLRHFYRPFNEKFYHLSGVDFGWS